MAIIIIAFWSIVSKHCSHILWILPVKVVPNHGFSLELQPYIKFTFSSQNPTCLEDGWCWIEDQYPPKVYSHFHQLVGQLWWTVRQPPLRAPEQSALYPERACTQVQGTACDRVSLHWCTHLFVASFVCIASCDTLKSLSWAHYSVCTKFSYLVLMYAHAVHVHACMYLMT